MNTCLFSKRPLPVYIFFTVTMLLLSAAPFVSAQNGQYIIPLNDPGLHSDIYRTLDSRYIISGRAVPSGSRPWSKNQAEFISGRLEGETAQAPLSTLAPLYTEEKTGLSFYSSATIKPEAYLFFGDPAEKARAGYEERQPLLHIPLEVGAADSVWANFELDMKEEHLTAVPGNRYNVPADAELLDLHFPFRTYLSWGGDQFFLQFGRDNLNWGNGQSGNTILSNYADNYDFLRLQAFWDNFAYSYAYISLDAWLTPEEQEVWGEPEKNPSGGGYENFDELYKAYAVHRLEFRTLWDKLSLAATEGILFGNKYPRLRDFNPLMLFHNWDIPERANSIAGAEFTLTPWRYINLYGQYTSDEYKAPPEAESGGTRPKATASLYGARGAYPLAGGYLSAHVEYAETDPWLYNRWHPLTKITWSRRYWTYVEDKWQFIKKPLGYYAGPDAKVLDTELSFKIDAADILIGYTRETTTKMDLSTKYSRTNWKNTDELAGTAETSHIAEASLSVRPFCFLPVSMRQKIPGSLEIYSRFFTVYKSNADYTADNTTLFNEWILGAGYTISRK